MSLVFTTLFRYSSQFNLKLYISTYNFVPYIRCDCVFVVLGAIQKRNDLACKARIVVSLNFFLFTDITNVTANVTDRHFSLVTLNKYLLKFHILSDSIDMFHSDSEESTFRSEKLISPIT